MATPSEIRAALAISAELVAAYGVSLLPVFLRLESEAAAISDINSALARAQQLATERRRW